MLSSRFLVLLFTFALSLLACDPSDWKGKAPYAPDCSEDDCPESPDVPGASVGQDAGVSHDKHGPQGANTQHFAALQLQSGATYDWCNGSTPATAGHCMKTLNKWYGSQWVDVNNTGRVRTISKIEWSYCRKNLPGQWDWNPANVLICAGPCTDVANEQTITGGSGSITCRSGSTHALDGIQWPAFGWGIFDITIRPRPGNVMPILYPQTDMYVWYTDGP